MMVGRSEKDNGARWMLLLVAFAVIGMGLALRRYGYAVGLPFLVVKYGGSVLWGSMVYLLVAAAMPAKKAHLSLVFTCVLAIAVEFVRLIHAPALDAFRATTSGALLLGRVFSPWNILCYLTGIAVAVLIAKRFSR